MEKKSKGFILAESLVVSTFVLGTLVFLYVQFSNVNKKYDASFRYNTVEGLYAANHIKTYVMSSGYSTLTSHLSVNSLLYVDITSCSTEYLTENSQCQHLMDALQIRQVLFTNEDLTELKKNLENDTNLSEGMKDFIRVTSTDFETNQYRLIVEFENDTYASIKVYR